MKRILLGASALLMTLPAMAQMPMPLQVAPPPQIAPRMDMTQTRDQVIAKVRTHFARMDVNRDGFVAGAEMQSMRGRDQGMGQRGARGGGRMAMANPGAAFDRLDANRDGMISREEFGRAREMREQRRMVRNEAPGAPGIGGERKTRMGGMRGRGGMMKMADLDRDGRVSLQEATTSALQRFDRVDANRDGRITPDERRQQREMRKATRGNRAG